MVSPRAARPLSRSAASPLHIISSVFSPYFMRKGCTPQTSESLLHVRSRGVKAIMGLIGLIFDMTRAVSPLSLKTTTAFAPTSVHAAWAAKATAWVNEPSSWPFLRSMCFCASAASSASPAMRAIISTARTGYLPTAVSPESIRASVPSNTALATSEASARVGLGLLIIDSNIWVAVMTTLPASLASEIIFFCKTGTRSGESSTPRSPLAIIIPSDSSIMASRSPIASAFSILAITGISLPLPSSLCLSIALSPATSAAFLTKESAM